MHTYSCVMCIHDLILRIRIYVQSFTVKNVDICDDPHEQGRDD